MRLDDGGFTTQAALYHIGINRSLYKKIYSSDFFCFFLEYPDKLFSNNLSFLFRLFYTCQFIVKSFLRIYTDEIQIVRSFRAEYCFNLISFIFTQKAMIHKHTRQLTANCFGKHHRCYGRVYSARKGAKHFRTNLSNGIFYKCLHFPVSGTCADIFYKVIDHLCTLCGM